MANMGSFKFPSSIFILFVVLFGLFNILPTSAESQVLLPVNAGEQHPLHNLAWESSSQSSKIWKPPKTYLEHVNPFSMDQETSQIGEYTETTTVAEKLTPE